jgi:hypothetical protein
MITARSPFLAREYPCEFSALMSGFRLLHRSFAFLVRDRHSTVNVVHGDPKFTANVPRVLFSDVTVKLTVPPA